MLTAHISIHQTSKKSDAYHICTGLLILSAVHSYLEKGISSRLSILLLCFRFQHVKDRFRDSESLRAEHRGNDPRNWPLYFQCPCRHIRHNLYMIHKQSVDKEQSKSTRGHRTSEKKKFPVSLFLFGFRTTLTPIYIHLIPSRRSRKEVFQPHLPVRLPCYDLAPITSFALGRPSR